IELARCAPGAAPDAQRFAGGGELLDAVVAVLDDVEVAPGAEGEIVGVRELAGLAALAAEMADEDAVAGEDLDAVVTGVGGVEQAVWAQGEGADAGELAGLAALAAPGRDVLAIAVELGDALHLAELGHVEVAVVVLDHVADVAELSRGAAGA